MGTPKSGKTQIFTGKQVPLMATSSTIAIAQMVPEPWSLNSGYQTLVTEPWQRSAGSLCGHGWASPHGRWEMP